MRSPSPIVVVEVTMPMDAPIDTLCRDEIWPGETLDRPVPAGTARFVCLVGARPQLVTAQGPTGPGRRPLPSALARPVAGACLPRVPQVSLTVLKRSRSSRKTEIVASFGRRSPTHLRAPGATPRGWQAQSANPGVASRSAQPPNPDFVRSDAKPRKTRKSGRTHQDRPSDIDHQVSFFVLAATIRSWKDECEKVESSVSLRVAPPSAVPAEIRSVNGRSSKSRASRPKDRGT